MVHTSPISNENKDEINTAMENSIKKKPVGKAATFKEIKEIGEQLTFSNYYQNPIKEALAEIEKGEVIYTYNAMGKFISDQAANNQYMLSYIIYAHNDYASRGYTIPSLAKTYFDFIGLTLSTLPLEMQQSLMSKVLTNLNQFIERSSNENLDAIEVYDHQQGRPKSVIKNKEVIMAALDCLNAMSSAPENKELFKNIGESMNPQSLSLIKSFNLKYLPSPYNQAFIKAVEASGTNNLSLIKNLNEIMQKNSQSAQFLVQHFTGWTESANLAVFFDNATSKKSVDEFLVHALKQKKIDAQKLSHVEFVLKFLKRESVSPEFKIHFISQIFSSLNHPNLISPLMTWMQQQISSNHEAQALFDSPPFNFKQLMENQIKFHSLKELLAIQKNNSVYSQAVKDYLAKDEGKQRIKKEYLHIMSTPGQGSAYNFENFQEHQSALGKDFLSQKEKENILIFLFQHFLSQGAEIKNYLTAFALPMLTEGDSSLESPTNTSLDTSKNSDINPDASEAKAVPATPVERFNSLFSSLIDTASLYARDYASLLYFINTIYLFKENLNEENFSKVNSFLLNKNNLSLLVDAVNDQHNYYVEPVVKTFLVDSFLKSHFMSSSPLDYINSTFALEPKMNCLWNNSNYSSAPEVLDKYISFCQEYSPQMNFVVNLKKENPLHNIMKFCLFIDSSPSYSKEFKTKTISGALKTIHTLAVNVFKNELNHFSFADSGQTLAHMHNRFCDGYMSKDSQYRLDYNQNFSSALANKKKNLTIKEKLFKSDIDLEFDLAQSMQGSYAQVTPTSVVISQVRPKTPEKSSNSSSGSLERNNTEFYAQSQAACEEVRKTLQQSSAKGNLLNLEFKIKVDSVIINYLSFVKLIQHTPTSFLDENMYFLKTSLTQYLNEACIFYDSSVSKYSIMVEAKNSHLKKLLTSNNVQDLDEYRENLDKKAVALIVSLESQLEIVKGNVLNDLAASSTIDLDRLGIQLGNLYNQSTIQSVPLKDKIDTLRPAIAPPEALTASPEAPLTSKGANVLRMNGKQ